MQPSVPIIILYESMFMNSQKVIMKIFLNPHVITSLFKVVNVFHTFPMCFLTTINEKNSKNCTVYVSQHWNPPGLKLNTHISISNKQFNCNA